MKQVNLLYEKVVERYGEDNIGMIHGDLHVTYRMAREIFSSKIIHKISEKEITGTLTFVKKEVTMKFF